jgi:hypothetical protein
MQLRFTACLHRIILFFLLSFVVTAAFSQTIRGKVFDNRTGEPLAGANVHLVNTKYYTVVNLDGSYTFRNLQPGKYELDATMTGYKKAKGMEISVAAGRITAADLALEADVSSLREVMVTGNADKSSDHTIRNMEKNGDMVQNILSEKTIQLLPDVTVANALQRVSGVTIQRDNTGEGRYAIIRGMDQRYNNTLVNGIKIPSPDDRYRFVPMDIFPSEMLERLEVIKALTPNMEGDAIGGTMNLVMKSAPDRFLLSANVSGGYNTLFSDRPFSSFPHSGINKSSPAEIHGNNYSANPISDFPVGALHYTNSSAPINSTLVSPSGTASWIKNWVSSYLPVTRISTKAPLPKDWSRTPNLSRPLPPIPPVFPTPISGNTIHIPTGSASKTRSITCSTEKIASPCSTCTSTRTTMNPGIPPTLPSVSIHPLPSLSFP